jgi:hypothetical protein
MAQSYLTLEDGISYILLEDGSKIILDPGIPIDTSLDRVYPIEASM